MCSDALRMRGIAGATTSPAVDAVVVASLGLRVTPSAEPLLMRLAAMTLLEWHDRTWHVI